MSLTIGSAPFGRHPAGTFNFELSEAVRRSALYFERSPRWVRGRFGGETVVDSRAPMLLHEHGHLPVYYFPTADVRTDLLEPSDRLTRCPRKGHAVHHTLRVGTRIAQNAAWSYPEPIRGAPPLQDHLAFYWSAMDSWLEEDEEIYVHARDPYHRVDVLRSSRHVHVAVHGETLAESSTPRMLFESGLPPRFYFAPTEVNFNLLEAIELTTSCPYKGDASYFDAVLGAQREPALAWSYPEPLAAVGPIAGQVCFFNERVDLVVDGEPQPRPHTRWSTTDWLGGSPH